MVDIDHYPTVALRSVCADFRPGFARQPNENGAGMFQLRMPNISRSGHISLDDKKFVDCSTEEAEKYRVQNGDVIFNNTNSPELVGNAAVYLHQEPCILSNHMTRIRVHGNVLYPGFLAWILHHYWKTNQTQGRSKQWINQAAIDLATLAGFKIPLPPLSEQRRIVAILHEAEEVRALDSGFTNNANAISLSLFSKHFGNRDVINRPLSQVISEFRYGTSISSGNSGSITLRIPNIIGDRISYDDLVRVSESDSSIDKLSLRDGDMLFVRTNGSPEYIGRCGVFNRTQAVQELKSEDPVIYASYLIRGRVDADVVRPWFLHSFLRTALGRARTLKRARTTGGNYNINIEDLGSIVVPVPSLDEQDVFLNELSAAQAVIQDARKATHFANTLFASLSAHSFSGKLTATWRDRNRGRLGSEADDRDKWLAAQSVTHSRQAAPVDLKITGRSIPLPTGLTTDQAFILMHMNPDEPSAAAYVTAQTLAKDLEGRLRHDARTIDGHLAVLAERGLIIPVSREVDDPDAGTIYGRAYRLPRNEDRMRSSEIARLAATLGTVSRQ